MEMNDNNTFAMGEKGKAGEKNQKIKPYKNQRVNRLCGVILRYVGVKISFIDLLSMRDTFVFFCTKAILNCLVEHADNVHN